MRGLFLGVVLYCLANGSAGAEPLCGIDCLNEWQYTLISVPVGAQRRLRLPVMFTATTTDTASHPDSAPSQFSTQALGSLRIDRFRPHLDWNSALGDSSLRLNGNRLSLRFDSPDKLRQMQFSARSHEFKIEYRLRY